MTEIKIRDIEGLQDRINTIDRLADNIVNGPFTFSIGVVTQSLSIGYPSQILDPSYNFDVNCTVRIVKDTDIFGNLLIDKTLYVNKLTTLNHSCIINGDLIANKDSYLNNNVSVLGKTFLNRTLDVSGNTSLGSQLFVNGSSVFNDNVSVLGKTFLNRTLDVSGNTSLGSQLFVNASSVFNDNVSVLGKTFLNRTLDVSGNTSLWSQLFVNGSSVFNDNVSVLGKTFLNRTLDVSGNTSIWSQLFVNGSSVFNDNVSVLGKTFLNRTLDVSGNTSLWSQLFVNGSSVFNDNVSVLGKTFLNRTLDVSGNTSLWSQLFVNGSSVFNDNVSVLGKTFLNRTLDVSGNTSLWSQLFVNGSSVFNDNVSVLGKTFLNRTLDVSGNTSLWTQLFVNGSSVFNDNVSVLGKTFLNRTLDVSGNTSLWSQLFVNGSSVFNNNVSVLGKTFLNRTLDVSGNTSLWSQLFVNGSSSFKNDINVLGVTTLNGNVSIYGYTEHTGAIRVTDSTTLESVTVNNVITMKNKVNISNDTIIDTDLYVGQKATFLNASVNNDTTLNKLKVDGTTILNGTVDINSTATINDLEVFATTKLGGSKVTLNSTDIELDGNITVPIGNDFIVNGNMSVDILYYKALSSQNTTAQLYTEGNAITRLEVADFISTVDNTLNLRGAVEFKTNVKYTNSKNPAYKTTFQMGESEYPMKMLTYSDKNSEIFLNGHMNVNTSSYNTGGFDYSGPFTVRGKGEEKFTIYSPTTDISSNITNIKGILKIHNQLRILPGGSILIDSPDTTLIDLQKVVQISSQLNISNNGTGPAIRASQKDPQFAEIMLLESDGLDVYSVGGMGNTQIKGKIRLGYDVISSENTNVANNPYDKFGSSPFLDYQLDISGSCIISKNISILQDLYTEGKMDVFGNMSVHGTTFMEGLLTLKNDLTSYSDRRIKKNIVQLVNCLDKITTIHGYTFQRRDRYDDKCFIGMIAQEIEGPFPELVNEFEERGTSIKTVNYPAFTSVLLECIQELKERIILLENKIFG